MPMRAIVTAMRVRISATTRKAAHSGMTWDSPVVRAPSTSPKMNRASTPAAASSPAPNPISLAMRWPLALARSISPRTSAEMFSEMRAMSSPSVGWALPAALRGGVVEADDVACDGGGGGWLLGMNEPSCVRHGVGRSQLTARRRDRDSGTTRRPKNLTACALVEQRRPERVCRFGR